MYIYITFLFLSVVNGNGLFSIYVCSTGFVLEVCKRFSVFMVATVQITTIGLNEITSVYDRPFRLDLLYNRTSITFNSYVCRESSTKGRNIFEKTYIHTRDV
jgi:hypothetical protein